MILVFLVCFEIIYSTSSYEYSQNVSFDLAILFRDSGNLTAINGCGKYFGNKNKTILTLLSIDDIFHKILISYQNKSLISIQKNPQTQLHNSLINCSSYPNLIRSKAYFVIQTFDSDTNIIDSFFIESSEFLGEYLEDATITLSFHHKIIIINNNIDVARHETNFLYLLFLLLLIILLIIICIRCYYVVHKYKQENVELMTRIRINELNAQVPLQKETCNVTVINQTLVLIIAISEFEDKTYNLPEVTDSVKHLKKLWDDVYNYSVFVSQNGTKKDIIKFLDQHLQSQETQSCVIIHFISHTCQNNKFLSSDMDEIPLEHIKTQLCNFKHDSVKIIFNHGCKGETDYYRPSNSTNLLRQTISKSLEEIKENSPKIVTTPLDDHDTTVQLTKINVSNKSATPSGTEQIRLESLNTASEINNDYGALEDTNFVVVSATIDGRALLDSSRFSKCIADVFEKNCHRFVKHGLLQLLTEVGNEMWKINKAEICSFTSTLRYEKVQFEKSQSK